MVYSVAYSSTCMAFAAFFFYSVFLATAIRVLCALVSDIEADAATLSRSFCMPISFMKTWKSIEPLKVAASPAIFGFGGWKSVSSNSSRSCGGL